MLMSALAAALALTLALLEHLLRNNSFAT